jgi:hypothetical protein
MLYPILHLGQIQVRTGKRREKRLVRDWQSRGFQVLNAKNYNTGVDLLVIDPRVGRICVAIESTNYSKGSYIAIRRAQRYANSLNQFPYADKILVISYNDNVGQVARGILQRAGVQIKVVGYQE